MQGCTHNYHDIDWNDDISSTSQEQRSYDDSPERSTSSSNWTALLLVEPCSAQAGKPPFVQPLSPTYVAEAEAVAQAQHSTEPSSLEASESGVAWGYREIGLGHPSVVLSWQCS